jgi:hypothetical protein
MSIRWEIWGRMPSDNAVSLLAKIPDPDSDFPDPTPEDEELSRVFVRQLQNTGYVDVEARRIEDKE